MQNSLKNKKKIAIIVSSPMTVIAFLVNQIKALSNIYIISITINIKKDSKDILDLPKNVDLVSISIDRNISLMNDTRTLWKLYRIFRIKEFDLIYSVSPKAGLLSVLSGFLSNIPIRIHIFTGQVWYSKKGISRFFFKFIDRVISLFATYILVDSNSQREFLIKENVISRKNSKVLGNGSICGVDLNRFRSDKNIRKKIRANLEIDKNSSVILFVGRLNRDKGVIDLANAFQGLQKKMKSTSLIFVGPDEENIKSHLVEILEECKEKVYFIPQTEVPEYFMMSSDILVLPSYREGFGNVIIEAAACGIPSIASNIYGLTDAVSNQETGILFEAGNVEMLQFFMEEFLRDKKTVKKYGNQALKRAQKKFSHEVITVELLDFFKRCLEDKNEKDI